MDATQGTLLDPPGAALSFPHLSLSEWCVGDPFLGDSKVRPAWDLYLLWFSGLIREAGQTEVTSLGNVQTILHVGLGVKDWDRWRSTGACLCIEPIPTQLVSLNHHISATPPHQYSQLSTLNPKRSASHLLGLDPVRA